MSSGNVTLHIRNPAWVFILPSIFCLALWMLAPIDFIYSGDASAILLAVLLPTFFTLGILIGFRRYHSSEVHINLNITKVRRFTILLSILGASGLTIRLIERIFIRARGSIGADFIVNRELMEAGGNGALALLGGVLSTLLLLLPFYVILLRRLGEKSWRCALIITLTAAYPISDILLQGSRITLIMYIGTFSAAMMTFHKARLRLRHLISLLLIITGLAWISGQVFALRTEQMGLDPVVSMYTSAYAHFAPASNDVTRYLSSAGIDGLGGLVYAYVHLCQYFLHGFYEFIYVATNVEEPTTHGLQSLYIPAKITSSLMGGENIESLLISGTLRPGVYTTLFGPWVYDFGSYGSLLASLLLGFCTGSLARLLRKGNTSIIPLYIVIIGFLPFSFVVNLFTSGAGQYALLGACLLYIPLSSRSFRASN